MRPSAVMHLLLEAEMHKAAQGTPERGVLLSLGTAIAKANKLVGRGYRLPLGY